MKLGVIFIFKGVRRLGKRLKWENCRNERIRNWRGPAGSRWSEISILAAALGRKADKSQCLGTPRNLLWSQDLRSEAKMSLRNAIPQVWPCKSPCSFWAGENERSSSKGGMWNPGCIPPSETCTCTPGVLFYQTGVQYLLTLRAVRRPGSLSGSNGLPRYDYLPCLFLVMLGSLCGTSFLPSQSIASRVADPTHWLQGWAYDSGRSMHFCWGTTGKQTSFFLKVTQLVEGKPDLLMIIWFLEGVSLSENKANTEENRDEKWRVLITYFWAPGSSHI